MIRRFLAKPVRRLFSIRPIEVERFQTICVCDVSGCHSRVLTSDCRHDQNGAGAARRADGAEQVSQGEPPVVLAPWTRAAFGPDAGERAVLSGPRFIFAQLGFGQMRLAARPGPVSEPGQAIRVAAGTQSRGVRRSMPQARAANSRECPSNTRAMARMRRACLASAVRPASARNYKTLRSLRVTSTAGRPPAPRIGGMPHRATVAAAWESPESSGP